MALFMSSSSLEPTHLAYLSQYFSHLTDFRSFGTFKNPTRTTIYTLVLA